MVQCRAHPFRQPIALAAFCFVLCLGSRLPAQCQMGGTGGPRGGGANAAPGVAGANGIQGAQASFAAQMVAQMVMQQQMQAMMQQAQAARQQLPTQQELRQRTTAASTTAFEPQRARVIDPDRPLTAKERRTELLRQRQAERDSELADRAAARDARLEALRQ